MNQTTEQVEVEKKKSPLMKFLAVIVFIIIITFCAWAAIRLVTILPTAFSSLANLAESVYKHDPYDNEEIDIEVTPEVTNVEHDKAFTISWNEINTAGQLTFSYECVDGVALQITVDDETYNVSCGEDLYLSDDLTELQITISSEKLPVAYVPYTVTFTPDRVSLDVVDSTNTVTVTNDDIPNRIVNDNIDNEEDTTEDDSEDTTTEVTTTKTIAVYTYEMPVSDPDGYTDLAVEYLGVGTVSRSGAFTPKNSLDEDDDGAFQFSVKNIGTKTSDTWYFEGRTTSGTTFESGSQKPLKPNERAVITIGFDNTGEDGKRRFGITVYDGDDNNSSNNEFSKTITVK